jgi:hypothetical protein
MNRTELKRRRNSGLLAGYPDPVLTLTICPQMDYGTAMNSQCKTDSIEVCDYDHEKGYRATAAVREYSPYEHNHTAGRNEWQKPDGSRPDVLRPEMHCGQRLMTGDG